MFNITASWLQHPVPRTFFGFMFSLQSAQAGMMDEPVVSMFAFDKLEVSDETDNPINWEFDAWIKQGIRGIAFTSEGSRVNSENESENRLVYSQGIAPYWDAQIGIGYDTHEEETHNWGVIGIAGMAPYFFESNLHLYIDGDGVLGIRASSEKELLITQRLILTPEIEAEAYSDEIPEMKHGSGLSSVTLGLRLKYEFKREFAPYVGIEWNKKFGATADYSEDPQNTSFVAGVSLWF